MILCDLTVIQLSSKWREIFSNLGESRRRLWVFVFQCVSVCVCVCVCQCVSLRLAVKMQFWRHFLGGKMLPLAMAGRCSSWILPLLILFLAGISHQTRIADIDKPSKPLNLNSKKKKKGKWKKMVNWSVTARRWFLQHNGCRCVTICGSWFTLTDCIWVTTNASYCPFL